MLAQLTIRQNRMGDCLHTFLTGFFESFVAR